MSCCNDWRSTTTTARACHIVHQLLKTVECDVLCPDWDLCKLMRLECDICGGRYSIAVIAILAAARLLESEALEFARKGNVSTLTIKFNGNQTAGVLMEVADKWRKQAMECANGARKRFAYVNMSRPHRTAGAWLSSYCDDLQPDKCDNIVLTNCNWDCCEEDCSEVAA